jgi:hypothetical protein
MVAIIQWKIMLIPRRSKAWNGMERKYAGKISFPQQPKKLNKKYLSLPQKSSFGYPVLRK